ncbi:serine hydrolase [Phytohabitans flavus]|uniref:Beta-lactamase class A catalytic domain-containing protein n=1 Tax=Phytohabitans flavus TaxID=1076124 RepID=A0A6F8Y4Q1_9ACTN|nr:serine hydrolase [Phytohabitans flavus]BCB81037.1 hypothetical protein Pflav_074470 [Phytohabitans flavus]
MRFRAMVLAVATLLIGAVALFAAPAVFARRGDDPATPAANGAGAGGAVPSPSATLPRSASPSASPEAPVPTLAAGPVEVSVDGFAAWALLDRQTGAIAGSDNMTATSSTESMIKIWLVADYLRRTPEPSTERLAQASAAIRDSDNDAAQSLYLAGGGDEVVQRMISMCGMTETSIGRSGWWSYTQMSPRDAVRLGECVKNGTAAGPKWTAWVLNEMTLVRGTTATKDQHEKSAGGRWGIIDGLPDEIVQQGVAIKNGWTSIWADGNWHVNCLAVADDWVLAIMLRYPAEHGLDYGANVCRTITEQLVRR